MWDFKVDDDIKYAVNPASGYKQMPVDIKAKLIFTAKAECLQLWEQQRGLAPSFCSLSSPIFSSLKMTRYGNSDSVIIETPLMPLSCIKEYVAHLGFAGNTKEYRVTSFPIASSIIKDLEKDARL